jgi:hypothetical protein
MMLRPASSLSLLLAGATLLFFGACSSGEEPDTTGGAASGGQGGGSASGGRSAAGGTDASGGLGGGLGALGGAGSELPPGVESCSARAGSCETRTCVAISQPALHVSECSELSPSTNPPSIGAHYPYWANFGVYEEPLNPGHLLHSLEHSAVALLYNCELIEERGDSCDDFVEQLSRFYDEWPSDSLCSSFPHRLIVAPDPGLEVPFAATAWGHYLEGECFDEAAVADFVNAHYGKTYENICNPGVDPRGRCAS